MKISSLKAIAYHLEKGHDNGRISREALALFLRSLIPILEEKEQKTELCLCPRYFGDCDLSKAGECLSTEI